MPIASIYFIPLFIIKKCSNIFQGFCNRACNFGGMSLLLYRTTATTTITAATAFVFHGEAVTCSNFSKAFPSQNVADIDGSCCIRDANTLSAILFKTVQLKLKTIYRTLFSKQNKRNIYVKYGHKTNTIKANDIICHPHSSSHHSGIRCRQLNHHRYIFCDTEN
jgi:hypothetical protein